MEETQALDFNVIIPQKFSLSRHSQADKDKISQWILEENIRKCEFSLAPFYSEYSEFADFWRVKRKKTGQAGKNLFNSRTGESHRGIETLCTFWYRVLTSNDPYFEAVAAGNDIYGKPLSSEDLYAVEQILLKQKTVTHYKGKLLNALRSLATFGAVVCEQPFIQRPITGQKYMEATDFVLSPLIKTYFNTSMSDISLSHYIANVDYATDFTIMDMAMNDTESWDVDAIKRSLEEKRSGSIKTQLGAWARIQERMQRAGYSDLGSNHLNELINYHGRLSREIVSSALIEDLWMNEGDGEQNPHHVDFTIRILNGEPIVSIYPTQYGDWRTRFVTATYKQFELEPIGYGVPKIGKKAQLEMDFMTSTANDLSTMSLFNMWFVNATSGIKQSQLGIKPLNVIEVENVHDSVAPVKPDVNAIAYAMNLIAQLKTDFRSTTGASDTLQAIITKASATESSLAQTEAVRQQSVFAEIIGESLVREHFEICHLNNINHLDTPIWAALSGVNKPEYGIYTKDNIPRNVGIMLKTTSDKDYRPERIGRLTNAGQYLSSIRQMIPPEVVINGTKYLSKEIFRELGIDPRLLDAPVSMAEKLEMQTRLNLSGKGGSPGNLGNEIAGEIASTESGGIQEAGLGGTGAQQTPAGITPTSAV